MKVEIVIPDPPEGWVYAGYRKAVSGELICANGANGCWEKCEEPTVFTYPVAVKEPQWRPATAADEGKQARFKESKDCWKGCKLLHVDIHDTSLSYLVLPRGDVQTAWSDYCEVKA